MTTGAPPKPAPRPRPDEPVTLPALQSILRAPQRVGGRVETTLRTVDKMFYGAAAHVACAGAWAKTRCRASTPPQGPFPPSRSGWPRRRAPSPRGTPPRVRGRHRRDHPRLRPWERPRECGEDAAHRAPAMMTLGTPPRVRGRHLRVLVDARLPGNTPASAGKTSSTLTLRKRKRGTPPRVRGRQGVGVGLADGVGNTPASAGKTRYSECSCFSFREHPRECGEDTS